MSFSLDFLASPVDIMSEIYNDYHNWKIDEGLSHIDESLAQLNPKYEANREYVLNDPRLKLNKAYQIKSSLHTLEGMLYFRKSLDAMKKDKETSFGPVLDKIKNKSLTDEDLEQLMKQSMTSENSEQQKYFAISVEKLKLAISVDPKNPVPHFQLASTYKAVGGKDSLTLAEKELYLAAKLSFMEGDKASVKRALDVLKSTNAKSKYIRKTRKFLK